MGCARNSDEPEHEDCKNVEEPNGPKSLRRIRKKHINKVLARTGHDLDAAAEILAIPIEELRRLMRELKIRE